MFPPEGDNELEPLPATKLAAVRDVSPAILVAPVASFDPVSWEIANPWLAEGQSDDRTPMNGSVADSGGTPAEQRSLARRSHQAMFKKWSQARHD